MAATRKAKTAATGGDSKRTAGKTQGDRARPEKESKGRTAVIQTRVDPALREQADLILNRLGISTPDAIRIFLEQVVLRRGIPFDVRLPEEETAADCDEPCWSAETERNFQEALDSIDLKFGNALRNLAK